MGLVLSLGPPSFGVWGLRALGLSAPAHIECAHQSLQGPVSVADIVTQVGGREEGSGGEAGLGGCVRGLGSHLMFFTGGSEAGSCKDWQEGRDRTAHPMQDLPELPPSPWRPLRGVWLSGRPHFLSRDTLDPSAMLAGPWGRAVVPAGDRCEGALSGAMLGRLLSHFNSGSARSRKSNSAVCAWYIPKNTSSFWNRGSTQARGGDPAGQPQRRAVQQAGDGGCGPHAALG